MPDETDSSTYFVPQKFVLMFYLLFTIWKDEIVKKKNVFLLHDKGGSAFKVAHYQKLSTKHKKNQ